MWVVIANDSVIGNAAGNDFADGLATGLVHVHEYEALGYDHLPGLDLVGLGQPKRLFSNIAED